eukprot:6009867-Prymnesium_polylepis.1
MLPRLELKLGLSLENSCPSPLGATGWRRLLLRRPCRLGPRGGRRAAVCAPAVLPEESSSRLPRRSDTPHVGICSTYPAPRAWKRRACGRGEHSGAHAAARAAHAPPRRQGRGRRQARGRRAAGPWRPCPCSAGRSSGRSAAWRTPSAGRSASGRTCRSRARAGTRHCGGARSRRSSSRSACSARGSCAGSPPPPSAAAPPTRAPSRRRRMQ